MKKIIAICTALLVIVTSSFATEKFKTNFSFSYAHEIDNKAGNNYTETSLSNALRMQVSNESFIGMNATLTVALPYLDNKNTLNGEIGKIKGKQPLKVVLIAGPSINLPLTDFLKAFASIGLKGSFEYVNTQTIEELRQDFMTGIGIGGSFGFKVFSNKKINMVIGTDIYCDFFRTGTIITSQIPNVSIAYSPFIGVGFTL